MNPASVGLVVVSSSEGRALPYGKLEDVVSRDTAALNCHTNDDKYVSLVDPALSPNKLYFYLMALCVISVEYLCLV